VDGAGNIWVAQKSAGAILEFNPAGFPLNTIQMSAASRPSALYFDAATGQLMAGDEGPDMNIKIYSIQGGPTQVGTFGIQGGYLDTTTGIKGQIGDKRFISPAPTPSQSRQQATICSSDTYTPCPTSTPSISTQAAWTSH
jgi:hypothetical protein